MFLNFGEIRREERKEGGKDGEREEKKRKGGWEEEKRDIGSLHFFFIEENRDVRKRQILRH